MANDPLFAGKRQLAAEKKKREPGHGANDGKLDEPLSMLHGFYKEK